MMPDKLDSWGIREVVDREVVDSEVVDYRGGGLQRWQHDKILTLLSKYSYIHLCNNIPLFCFSLHSHP